MNKTKGDAMQEATNNMATVAKTQNQTKKQPIISKENRKKIARAYYQLYRAFLLRNLLSGMTLGAASHNAVQLVRAKIATMDKNNPATKYLLRLNSRHSKRIAKRVMTSKYRDAVPNIKPEERAKLAAFVSKKFNDAMAVFNTMSAQYKTKKQMVVRPKIVAKKPVPVVKKQNATARPNLAQQKLLLVIKMKQLQNQRTAA